MVYNRLKARRGPTLIEPDVGEQPPSKRIKLSPQQDMLARALLDLRNELVLVKERPLIHPAMFSSLPSEPMGKLRQLQIAADGFLSAPHVSDDEEEDRPPKQSTALIKRSRDRASFPFLKLPPLPAGRPLPPAPRFPSCPPPPRQPEASTAMNLKSEL
jgi:hypothetical protein